jgi:hypothetical protein
MFDKLPVVKNIGIKMSGGADSSLLAYLLAEYIVKNNLDINLFPIIIIEEDAPFQKIFAQQVIDFVEKNLNFKFCSPVLFDHYTKTDKIQRMRRIETDLLKTILDFIISGTTQNPKSGFDTPGGPDDNREGVFPEIWEEKIYTPFINKDKKELAELYKQHNLLNTLFPLTRSCVAVTDNFDKHCGECWWCKERIWAFGKL